jgi:site-specific recombinase XerC
MRVLDGAISPSAEEYLSWLSVERGRSANTLAAYRSDLVHYEAALAARGRTPLDADREDPLNLQLRATECPSGLCFSNSCFSGLDCECHTNLPLKGPPRALH